MGEWLRDHEPHYRRTKRAAVKQKHLAMPDKFKKAATSVEAYRDYYYSKRRTMTMAWPKGKVPVWWEERRMGKKRTAVTQPQRAVAAKREVKDEQPSNQKVENELIQGLT